MLWCAIICPNMRAEQNSLGIVLAINEYSNHPGICLHVAFSTGVFTANITEDCAFTVTLNISGDEFSKHVVGFLCVFIKIYFIVKTHEDSFPKNVYFPG